MEIEKFYGKIYKTGDSLVFTLPSIIAKYNGLKIGDELEIWIRKKRE